MHNKNNINPIVDSVAIRRDPVYRSDHVVLPEAASYNMGERMRHGTIVKVFPHDSKIDLVADMSVLYDGFCEDAWVCDKCDIIPLDNVWAIITGPNEYAARHRLVVIETIRIDNPLIPDHLNKKCGSAARVVSVGPDVKHNIVKDDIVIFEESRGGQHINNNLYIIDSNIVMAIIGD